MVLPFDDRGPGLKTAGADLYISMREAFMEESIIQMSRKAVLVVLFVPSVERDGITAINQEY